uniref:Protein lethal(2)essential for life n=1 Tax=Cacopsylla melanoneura TaxID=428564 RepID=A0A8D8U4L6_9HEMI
MASRIEDRLDRMSLGPLLFRDWWDEFDRPSRLLDQHFGLGLRRDDLLSNWSSLAQTTRPVGAGYLRPWRSLARSNSGSSNIQAEDNKVQVILDVQQFSPNEISIKTVDGAIVVEGKHEEKEDEHGFISRQFKRRYLLPKDVEIEKVTSSLSSDGVLTISAPRRTLQNLNTERPVPIVQTGAPAVKTQAPSSTQTSQPIITSPAPSVCGDAPRETNIKIEQH